jgi:hypothetical protein
LVHVCGGEVPHGQFFSPGPHPGSDVVPQMHHGFQVILPVELFGSMACAVSEMVSSTGRIKLGLLNGVARGGSTSGSARVSGRC